MAPYQSLSMDLPNLEALEVVEVAVWSHVELGRMLVGVEVQTLWRALH